MSDRRDEQASERTPQAPRDASLAGNAVARFVERRSGLRDIRLSTGLQHRSQRSPRDRRRVAQELDQDGANTPTSAAHGAGSNETKYTSHRSAAARSLPRAASGSVMRCIDAHLPSARAALADHGFNALLIRQSHHSLALILAAASSTRPSTMTNAAKATRPRSNGSMCQMKPRPSCVIQLNSVGEPTILKPSAQSAPSPALRTPALARQREELALAVFVEHLAQVEQRPPAGSSAAPCIQKAATAR
jgi:hypothetical protein